MLRVVVLWRAESLILILVSSLIRMLAGLMSQWITP
jgi:hypothetical protein